jgi:hypothetical protein
VVLGGESRIQEIKGEVVVLAFGRKEKKILKDHHVFFEWLSISFYFD